MNTLSQWAIAAVSLAVMGAGAAKADTLLQYTFDAGSYYDFQDGSSNTVTGSFTYDATTQTLSNVNYDRGGDIFTTGLVGSPKELYFGDTTSSDYDVYEFQNSLALGGTDMITGAYHPAIPITAGGSVTAGAGVGVPEPASWTLMLMGFGLAGYAMRRGRFRASLKHANG